MSIYIHYYHKIVSIMSGLFGSKPKDYVLRPGEVNELAMADWQRNNPNFYNPFGSSTTTFDGNQATVNQSFSPELQGLYDQSMAFLGQGPQQLGNTSSPFIEGAIGNAMGSVFGRTGQQMPQKPMQGGGSPPNPGLSFGYDQNLPTVPAPEQGPSMGEQIGDVFNNVAQAQRGGGESPYYGMGNNLGPLFDALQKRKKQYDFEVSQ